MKKYIIPSFITFIILGIIYYFNGLYPFGYNPLVQVDADFIYIPQIYTLYDLLHGIGNLFYTKIGLGQSIYASLIIQRSLYSPLNLLLYFINRNDIINLYGLFIIIKLCLISLTSYIYIEKNYKVEYFYKVLFSVLYTFNGFIILNYFNEIWLDIIILFPLLVLYLKELLNNKKQFGYIIILSMCFIITFYYSYFIVIFILIYSFIYLNLYKKKEIKEAVFSLGISTLIAFLISSFNSLPLIYQVLNSARFNFDTYTNMFSNIAMKSLYLLFTPIFVILFIKLLTKFKKDKVNIYGYFLLILLYVIPIIIDPVNALLHGGSYWSFPYRYGFVTSFIMMDCSLYYISKYVKKANFKLNVYDIIIATYIIIVGCLGVYLNFLWRHNIISDGILLDISNENYFNIMCIIVIVFLMYILILFIKGKWPKYILISTVSLYAIFMFSSWTIYYNSGYFLCSDVRDIYNNMNLPNDGNYKMEYDNYTPGYAFIFNVNTLDNWLHIIPKKQIDMYRRLGYYISDTNVHSLGGTIFTDYLLNFKYVLSKDDKMMDDMYELIDSYDDRYLYRYNYNESYGIVTDNIYNIDYINKFDYQNSIYKKFFNRDDNIINYSSYEFSDQSVIDIDYKIEDAGYLYFYTDDYNCINYITINDNNIYNFKNYIKYLGYFDSGREIKISLVGSGYFNFDIGFIKKEDMQKLKNQVEYKNNKYYVDATSEKYLFLPINNIDGIHVYNNGNEVKIYDYLDNFIGIKLNKGKNVIEIKYKLPLFKLGFVLSITGILLLLLYRKMVPNKLILNISYLLYIIMVIGMFLYYYFYSLFKYIVKF